MGQLQAPIDWPRSMLRSLVLCYCCVTDTLPLCFCYVVIVLLSCYWCLYNVLLLCCYCVSVRLNSSTVVLLCTLLLSYYVFVTVVLLCVCYCCVTVVLLMNCQFYRCGVEDNGQTGSVLRAQAQTVTLYNYICSCVTGKISRTLMREGGRVVQGAGFAPRFPQFKSSTQLLS